MESRSFFAPIHYSKIMECILTFFNYIDGQVRNAVAKAGFVVEQFMEEANEESLKTTGKLKSKTRMAGLRQ